MHRPYHYGRMGSRIGGDSTLREATHIQRQFGYGQTRPERLRSAGGRALSNWKFAVVMYEIEELEKDEQYGWPTIQEAWYAPENAYLAHSLRPPQNDAYFIDPTRTGSYSRFAAITGPGTAFDDDIPWQFIFESSSGGSRIVIPYTPILFVEVRNCRKHWMEPGGDLDVRTMDHTIGRGTAKDPSGVYADGFWVVFADGRCWYLSHDTPFADLARFFTVATAKKFNRDEVLAKYRIREVSVYDRLIPSAMMPAPRLGGIPLRSDACKTVGEAPAEALTIVALPET